MAKPKPKSAVAGVYYRDDGRHRWEVKIRWVNKDGDNKHIHKRFPIDPKAPVGAIDHISTAKKDAEAFAVGERRSLETHDEPLALRAEGWTFRALLERYLEDVEAGKIKHKSIKTTKAAINMMLGQGKGRSCNEDGFPSIADTWVKDLTYATFTSEDEDSGSLRVLMKDRDGNPVSNGALKRVLTVYKGVFVRAQEVWKIKLENPLQKIKGLSANDARERTIDEDEWNQIAKQLKQHEQGTQDVIHFARWTAARRSEVVKLDWPDINFKARTAFLRDTKSKGAKPVDRTIPVPARAWEIILARAQPADAKKLYTEHELVGMKLSGPVFTNGKGSRVLPDTVTQAWTRACKRAGIVGARIHDLRHTRITEMGRFLTAAEAARVSGHTDLATFFRYFNPDPIETGRKIDMMESGKKSNSGVQEAAEALAGLREEDFGVAVGLAIKLRNSTAGK